MSPFVHELRAAAPAGGIVVESTSTGGSPNQQTTHTVTLPTGFVAGDVVVVLFRCTGTGLTPPAGWTNLTTIGTTSSIIIYREMTGGEASTIDITTPNDYAAYNCYRLSGVATSEATYIVANGDFGTFDSPALTIPWGAGVESFVVSWASVRTTDNTLIAPSPYTDTIMGVTSEAETSGHARLSSARRVLSAASEDPATWTFTGTTGASIHSGVFAARTA